MKKAICILLMISLILTSCKPASQKISVISAIDTSHSDDGYTCSEKFNYNKDGNLFEILKTEVLLGVTLKTKTSFEYDENGFLQKSFTYYNDEMDYWCDYKCNSEGKIIEERKYAPNSDSFTYYTKYVYNSDGTLSEAHIHDNYLALFFTIEYSYNDDGKIILEENNFYDNTYERKLYNFSYSSDSDPKLMSFSLLSSFLGQDPSNEEYVLEYDSSGKLCKSITSYSDGNFDFTETRTYQHTVINATDKTTLFLSDGNQYYDPFLGIYEIESLI